MKAAARCASNPLAFAHGFWADITLRKWQAGILDYIGKWLRDPKTRYQPCRVAIASGHGIGKSALIGMLLHWGMSTCAGCKCVVTAGKGEQLATKTVPEVTKWFKSSLGAHWFECHAKSIRALSASNPESWRADFVTWSLDNTQTFAGVHNQGKRIIFVFDEASTIHDKVWDVANGALTDEDTEIIWLAFGQPTETSGRFRECFGSLAHRWKTFQIDSRTIEGTNKALFEEWVADYGEDSDFVRVRVRGEFPRAGSSQFISPDIVAAARSFRATAYEGLPKILSVDVARSGDDQTVIGVRQGRKFTILRKYRGKDTVFTAEETNRIMQEIEPDATVIDADGLGAGTYDHIKYRGFTDRLFEFHGGATADNTNAYFNRRAECWGLMRDWLKAGAEIPDDPELADQLCGPEYGFSSKSQIQLERKEDMKKRNPALGSPDCADTLAMTFHINVQKAAVSVPRFTHYDPSRMSESWMS